MEALTLKELKKIEKWFVAHEDDMDAADSMVYEKINLLIEDMLLLDEEDTVKVSLYDEDEDMRETDAEEESSYYDPEESSEDNDF